MVLIVRWSNIFGFEVQWPKPNLSDSSIVKNGLFPIQKQAVVKSQHFEQILSIIKKNFREITQAKL
jgi:hypothetical protein